MSIKASQLSKSRTTSKELDNLVKEQLLIIDGKLQSSGRSWGRNIIQHDLPIMINLPGLDKKDAQLIMYSAIIKSLERRGFEVRIMLEAKRTTLYIAWLTDLDVEEVEAMSAVLRQKRIEPEAVCDFIQKGSTSAPRSAKFGDGSARMHITEKGVMLPRGGIENTNKKAMNAAAAMNAAMDATLDEILTF